MRYCVKYLKDRILNVEIINLLLLAFMLSCCFNEYSFNQRQLDAIKCAENWKHQGYNFDPNNMTCWQMSQKVQAIRRAKYWKLKGYNLDPNSMTWEEMDQKVKDIDRSRYCKHHGYDFDPFSM